MSNPEKIGRDEAMSFLTEGAGAPSGIIKRTNTDGEQVKIIPKELFRVLNEAIAKLGIDPNDRNVDEIVTSAVSGFKRIGY